MLIKPPRRVEPTFFDLYRLLDEHGFPLGAAAVRREAAGASRRALGCFSWA
jgi:hypothetical protein